MKGQIYEFSKVFVGIHVVQFLLQIRASVIVPMLLIPPGQKYMHFFVNFQHARVLHSMQYSNEMVTLMNSLCIQSED